MSDFSRYYGGKVEEQEKSVLICEICGRKRTGMKEECNGGKKDSLFFRGGGPLPLTGSCGGVLNPALIVFG